MPAFLNRSFPEKALMIGALASALLLAGAHLFEAIGFAPCPLCLDQREAHWLALAVAGAGLVAAILFKARLAASAAVGAAALVYAVSMGLSGYHTGVEWKFWPGPKSCSAVAGTPASLEDISAGLEGKVGAVSCEDAAWRFLGVSMAGYNFLFSSGLFALTLLAALGAAREARRARRPAIGAAAGGANAGAEPKTGAM
jgi:disulfide bond formation protein DsbB